MAAEYAAVAATARQRGSADALLGPAAQFEKLARTEKELIAATSGHPTTSTPLTWISRQNGWSNTKTCRIVAGTAGPQPAVASPNFVRAQAEHMEQNAASRAVRSTGP